MDRDARQGRQAGLGVHLLGTCPCDMDAPSQPAAMEESAGSRLLSLHHRVSSLLLLASPPPFALPQSRDEREVQLAAETVADEPSAPSSDTLSPKGARRRE